MKIYEVKNGQRTTAEMLDAPFKSNCLDFNDVSTDFPDFIMIGYNDKQLMGNIPFYGINHLAFSIETPENAPLVKLEAFYDMDNSYPQGKDLESFEVEFNQAEQAELQSLMLQAICDLLYGAPIYLGNRLDPVEVA